MESSHATLPSCSSANYTFFFPYFLSPGLSCLLVSSLPSYHSTCPSTSVIYVPMLALLLICLLSLHYITLRFLRCVLADSFPSLPCLLHVSHPFFPLCTPHFHPFFISASSSARVLHGLYCAPLQLFLLPCIPFCPIILLPITSYFLVTSSASPPSDFLTDLSTALPSSLCHVPYLLPYLFPP